MTQDEEIPEDYYLKYPEQSKSDEFYNSVAMLKELTRLREQLKEERNRAIDEIIELTNEHDCIRNWPLLKKKLEALKK